MLCFGPGLGVASFRAVQVENSSLAAVRQDLEEQLVQFKSADACRGSTLSSEPLRERQRKVRGLVYRMTSDLANKIHGC